MQARFLLGPAGSGKTFRCLTEVRAELLKSPEGPPLLFLAPKQATFQLERLLLDSERWGERTREPLTTATAGSRGRSPHQLAGYTRLQILSFERLAEFVLAELSAAPPRLLDEEGRLMVLRALLAQRHKELRVFHATARLPGFAQQLSLLLRELQRHQLLDRRLAALAERADLPVSLRDKLHDLALLLRAYLDWLKQHELQDANGLLDLATDALQACPESRVLSLESQALCPESRIAPRAGKSTFSLQPSAFSLSGLWLDGFAEMTPQELDFLAALAPLCEQATLAFCLDREPAGDTSWLSMWSVVSRTFRSCHQRLASLPECEISLEILPRDAARNRFADNPALAHLEANWTQPRPFTHHAPRANRQSPIADSQSPIANGQLPIRLAACADQEAEAVLAAHEILRHVRGGGRFRDCTVLLRSLEGYDEELRRVFQRYEIPFFLDRREPVAHHPLAELTRFALRTVAFGWEHGDWFGALKTGLVTDDDEGVDALENAALARGWKGAVWRQPLKLRDDPQLEKRLDRLRKQIVPPFRQLAERLGADGAASQSQPTGSELSTALRELWAGLRVDNTLEQWSLPNPPHSALRTPHSAIHATVREQMQSWLDNLERAFLEEPMPLRDWLPILESGLASLSVGVIPPTLDQVLIGAVDRSRNPDLKLALVLGLNESVFPAAPEAAGLLTEGDRRALEAGGVALGPDKHAQLGHERYYGYIACTRASERLVLARARRDARNRELNPSPFFAQLQRLFPGIEVETDAPATSWLDSEHVCELAGPLLKSQISNSKSQNRGGLLQIPALESLRERLQTLANYAPDAALAPALAGQLYGPVLRTSVSRLEQFAACPFRFFVHAGLRAEERELFEADARERGSFQHEVLRRFHDEVRGQGREWRQLAPAEARELIGRIAARVTDEFREGLFRASPESAFAARSLTVALQDFMETAIGWMKDYGFDPRAVELSFGDDGDALPAWEMDLGDGHRMAFRGKIDRVDLEVVSSESSKPFPSEGRVTRVPNFVREPGTNSGLAELAPPGTDEARFVVMDYKSGGKRIDPVLLEHGAQIQLPAYLAALRRTPAARAIFGVARLIPAGAFYVNLRGDYQPGASRDEVLNEADGTRRRAYRHAGRFSLEALPQLDGRAPADNSGQFNYALTKEGRPNRRYADLLEPAEFNALLDRVETLLRDMGVRIFAGDARVDPYRKGSETACDYCACRAICRIDPWQHEFRVLKKKSNGGKEQ